MSNPLSISLYALLLHYIIDKVSLYIIIQYYYRAYYFRILRITLINIWLMWESPSIKIYSDADSTLLLIIKWIRQDTCLSTNVINICINLSLVRTLRLFHFIHLTLRSYGNAGNVKRRSECSNAGGCTVQDSYTYNSYLADEFKHGINKLLFGRDLVWDARTPV